MVTGLLYLELGNGWAGMLGCSVLTPQPHQSGGGVQSHILPHIREPHYHILERHTTTHWRGTLPHEVQNPVGDHDYTAD